MRNRVAWRAAAIRTATIASAATLLMAPLAAAAPPAAQLPAAQLPGSLVEALARDLKLTPQQYLERAELAQRLGSYAAKFRANHPKQFAGAWIAADGRATLGVTSPAAAKIATADGFRTKLQPIAADGLEGSMRQLNAWMRGLPHNLSAQIGTVGIDLINNQLIVNMVNNPVGQALNLPTLLARVKVVLAPGGGGPIVLRPMGGDTYISSTNPLNTVSSDSITVCSFGFNSVDGKGNALSISAGHCDPNVRGRGPNAPVYVPDVRNLSGSPQAGNFVQASLGAKGGLDYSVIKLNDRAVRAGMNQPRIRGANGTTLSITGVAEPVIGAPVCKSGQTSDFTCGLVTADNVETQLLTDNGEKKTVRGFATNACTLSGDSGGPIVSGTMALGITSGSNASEASNCTEANLGHALSGGTASLGIPISRILNDAGGGLRIRTVANAG